MFSKLKSNRLSVSMIVWKVEEGVSRSLIATDLGGPVTLFGLRTSNRLSFALAVNHRKCANLSDIVKNLGPNLVSAADFFARVNILRLPEAVEPSFGELNVCKVSKPDKWVRN